MPSFTWLLLEIIFLYLEYISPSFASMFWDIFTTNYPVEYVWSKSCPFYFTLLLYLLIHSEVLSLVWSLFTIYFNVYCLWYCINSIFINKSCLYYQSVSLIYNFSLFILTFLSCAGLICVEYKAYSTGSRKYWSNSEIPLRNLWHPGYQVEWHVTLDICHVGKYGVES